MDLSSVIDEIEAEAKKNLKTEPSDYIGQDGLLYCGNCNTPKQCRVVIFGKERTPYCLCKCGEEKRDREEAEQKARAEAEKKAERIKKLRIMGFPDAKLKDWTFANDDMTKPQITKAMQNYVDNFEELKKQGKGLLLYGNVGTGKTYAACEVVNALIDKGYPALVTSFSRITNTIQDMYNGKQEYLDSLNQFDLLVMDDLGAERRTDFMQEMVYSIIDGRSRSGLPFIVTTNLTINEIKNPTEIGYARIYERVLERCFPIEVAGVNRRREKVKEEYSDMKALLGL